MIYSANGCPLEIVARFDVPEGTALVQAKITGPYPDGSGKERIGQLLHAGDRTAQGWFPPWELRADNGIAEIREAVERLDVTREPLPEKQLRKLFKYYGMDYPG